MGVTAGLSDEGLIDPHTHQRRTREEGREGQSNAEKELRERRVMDEVRAASC